MLTCTIVIAFVFPKKNSISAINFSTFGIFRAAYGILRHTGKICLKRIALHAIDKVRAFHSASCWANLLFDAFKIPFLSFVINICTTQIHAYCVG